MSDFYEIVLQRCLGLKRAILRTKACPECRARLTRGMEIQIDGKDHTTMICEPCGTSYVALPAKEEADAQPQQQEQPNGTPTEDDRPGSDRALLD